MERIACKLLSYFTPAEYVATIKQATSDVCDLGREEGSLFLMSALANVPSGIGL
jgi:hypothetical protein